MLLGAGCARRSDIPTVRDAMQAEMEDVPGYVDGTIQYQDQATTGTVINGVLVITATTREEAVEVLARILEAVTRTYIIQSNTRTAYVRITARAEHDDAVDVSTGDIVAPADGGNATTDDLAEHFGLR